MRKGKVVIEYHIDYLSLSCLSRFQIQPVYRRYSIPFISNINLMLIKCFLMDLQNNKLHCNKTLFFWSIS